MEKRVKTFERFLIDNGLLFEINRKVLHPLGLALVIDVAPDARKKIIISGLIETTDSEGFLFDEETFDVGRGKFETYLKNIGTAKLEKRRATLGFTEQESSIEEPEKEEIKS